MSKHETLKAAIDGRIEEVLHYQINIDNYSSAMKKIEERYCGDSEMDKAMREFHKTLKQLHDSSVVEREKASLMLEVIKEQLGEP